MRGHRGEGAKGVGRRVEERGRKPRRSGPGRGEGEWNRVTDGPAWTGRPCVRGDSLAIPHSPKLSDDLSGRRGRTDRQGSEGPPAARAHLLGAEAAGRLVTLGSDTSELRSVCRLGGVSRRDPGEVAAKGPPARPRASRHRGVLGGSGGAPRRPVESVRRGAELCGRPRWSLLLSAFVLVPPLAITRRQLSALGRKRGHSALHLKF